jgi:hypothetical protein
MTEIKKVSNTEARRHALALNLGEEEWKAMDFALLMSTVIWAMFIDKKLACLWGLIPPTLMSHQAYLWFYTTDVIVEHQFVLVRHSQMAIEEILKDYPSIVGHATMGADKSIRWLKWLGAEFGPPQGTGVPFRITRDGRSNGSRRNRI